MFSRKADTLRRVLARSARPVLGGVVLLGFGAFILLFIGSDLRPGFWTASAQNPIPVPTGNSDLEGLLFGGNPGNNSDWTDGNVCAGNLPDPGCYSDGEDVPHRALLVKLTVGVAYELAIEHDFEDNSGVVGYENFNDFAAISGVSNLTSTFVGVFPSGGGRTEKWWTVEFLATAASAEIRWDALLGPEAHSWNGAQLHVRFTAGAESVPIPVNKIVPPPTLTLVKTVINNNGGTKVVADFPLFIDGSPVTSGVANTVTANVVHTASETQQGGYTASAWGGDCAANGTITLLPGDNKTCTVANDDIGPTLTLVKTAINNNGGTKVVADFPLFVDGSPVTSGVAKTVTANVVHTASETQQAGYTASVWGGDCAANGTITLLPGDNKTCTITNDDIGSTLTLVNTVITTNGGTKVVADFPLFIDGSPVTSGVAKTVTANVVHTAGETQQAGYTASVWGGD